MHPLIPSAIHLTHYDVCERDMTYFPLDIDFLCRFRIVDGGSVFRGFSTVWSVLCITGVARVFICVIINAAYGAVTVINVTHGAVTVINVAHGAVTVIDVARGALTVICEAHALLCIIINVAHGSVSIACVASDHLCIIVIIMQRESWHSIHHPHQNDSSSSIKHHQYGPQCSVVFCTTLTAIFVSAMST